MPVRSQARSLRNNKPICMNRWAPYSSTINGAPMLPVWKNQNIHSFDGRKRQYEKRKETNLNRCRMVYGHQHKYGCGLLEVHFRIFPYTLPTAQCAFLLFVFCVNISLQKKTKNLKKTFQNVFNCNSYAPFSVSPQPDVIRSYPS